MKLLTAIIFLCYVLCSCNVQKPLNGFGTSNNQITHVAVISEGTARAEAMVPATVLNVPTSPPLLPFSALIPHRPNLQPRSSQQTPNRQQRSCDTIYFRNGTVVTATVVSIKKGQLFYRLCGTSEPLMTVYNTDVSSIKHADGTSRLVLPGVSASGSRGGSGEALEVVSLIVGLIFLGLVAALLYALVAAWRDLMYGQ